GEEILVRVFKRNDSDDHPFEVGKDYVCFLWKRSDCPATPLNRSQVAIRLEGEELLMTKDAYTAVKGTMDRLRSGSEAVVQNNENTDDYEDIILKGGRNEILSMIREMAAEKE
ncbi:MAG: hypothetical protein K2N94_02480, partial [Lachnospiraceae bacterium]|nr:hypothetical protein [Lachnospiraceae bacterium]